jgi:hypothetical protein
MTTTYPCHDYLDGVWKDSLRLLGDYCLRRTVRVWSSLSRAVNATPTTSPPREKRTRFQDSHVEGRSDHSWLRWEIPQSAKIGAQQGMLMLSKLSIRSKGCMSRYNTSSANRKGSMIYKRWNDISKAFTLRHHIDNQHTSFPCTTPSLR